MPGERLDGVSGGTIDGLNDPTIVDPTFDDAPTMLGGSHEANVATEGAAADVPATGRDHVVSDDATVSTTASRPDLIDEQAPTIALVNAAEGLGWAAGPVPAQAAEGARPAPWASVDLAAIGRADVASQVSTLSVGSPATQPPPSTVPDRPAPLPVGVRPARGRLAAAAAVALVAVVGAAGLFLARSQGASQATTPTDGSTSIAALSASGSGAASSAPSAVASTPTPSGSAEPIEPPSSAAASASSAPDAASSAGAPDAPPPASASAAPRAPSSSPAKAPSSSKPSCSPPFTIDKKGIRRLKPHCM